MDLTTATPLTPTQEFVIFLRNSLIERQKKNPRFSLRSFARMIGISPSSLSMILNGKQKPTSETIEKIKLRLSVNTTLGMDK